MSTISADQYQTLMRPLNSARVAKRSQGGKQLSYLESWDVKATLIRVFGFTNFDSEITDCYHVDTRQYVIPANEQKKQPAKDMVEVIWYAKVQLSIRNEHGDHLARYSEGAVGSASGPPNMLGEHHDNALKTAASDAIKRCAIFLGTQFGLGLYDHGSTNEVVRLTIPKPPGMKEREEQAAKANAEQEAAAAKRLEESLGAKPVTPTGEGTNEGGVSNGNSEPIPPQHNHAEEADCSPDSCPVATAKQEASQAAREGDRS